ncbi:serine/threonine-protein phosphatase 7 long form like, partial [Trifolium medium]|nr:serine/threonine-protein phosphatase 7 long form like [Trifolium medium]
MQFGIDQDVPGCVPRFSGTKEIAWKNYCRPIFDKHLYFPSRFFEADVTSRYSRWWKQSVLSQCCSGSSEYHGKILPLKRPISADNIEPSIESLEEVFEDAHGSKEAMMSSDRISLSDTQGESKRFSMRKKVSLSNKVTAVQHDLQFHSDMIAQ